MTFKKQEIPADIKKTFWEADPIWLVIGQKWQNEFIADQLKKYEQVSYTDCDTGRVTLYKRKR